MSFGLDPYFKKKKPPKKKSADIKEESTMEVLETAPSGTRDWRAILEETVTSMVLYPHLLDYTRTHILPKHPKITAEELAIQLRIPLGVAIILLGKLNHEILETK